MTQVLLSENESIESAPRRFKRQVSKAGTLTDASLAATLKLRSRNVSASKSLLGGLGTIAKTAVRIKRG